MRIDAHQHFWTLARSDYGWLTPALGAIHRDFGPDDLTPLLAAQGIARTILVQAAPTEAETEFLLAIAARTPAVAGVVGWCDFDAAAAPERIARLSGNPILVGLRPMVHDIPDPNWLAQEANAPAFDAMIAHDLVFDALLRPMHIAAALRMLQRHPDLSVVIDHAAKPELAGEGATPFWRDGMRALASHPQVYCKLSGLVTEAAPDWTLETLRPVVDHLLTVFGPDRLIWGSDWPVVTLRADYARWFDTAQALLAGLSKSEREAVFGLNAQQVYLSHRGRN